VGAAVTGDAVNATRATKKMVFDCMLKGNDAECCLTECRYESLSKREAGAIKRLFDGTLQFCSYLRKGP